MRKPHGPTTNLEVEMELQRRDQEIKERYEKDLKKMREMHQRELQNALDGLEAAPKKRGLLARIRRVCEYPTSTSCTTTTKLSIATKECPTHA